MPYGFKKKNEEEKQEALDYKTPLSDVFEQKVIDQVIQKTEILPMTLDNRMYSVEEKADFGEQRKLDK